jgi:hypothetical protein
MEKYGDGQKKMEGHCSTGQSSHRAVVPAEEEEDIVIRLLLHLADHIIISNTAVNQDYILSFYHFYTILFYFYAIYGILINVNHYGIPYGMHYFIFLDILAFKIYILT